MKEKTKVQIPRVMLLYHVMIPSVRLCGHSQMEALAHMGMIEYRPVKMLQMTQEDFEWADIVVIGRLDGQAEYNLAQTFHDAGKRLIYVIDDDLLNVPEGIQSAPHYAQEPIRQSILGMMGLSEGILSPSPLLLEKYATKEGQLKLLTEEPALDAIPYAPHDPEAPIKIGFAGSVDRANDVQNLLGDALRQIKKEYGDQVAFEFFGVEIPLAKELGARVLPYTMDYADYRRVLNESGWDIGLAPMPDSPFCACKHYNKFIEYAAAGVVGIFSDHEPYARLHRTIGLGLFCENTTEEWVNALRSLIDDRAKLEDLRRQVCECAAGPLNIDVIAQRLYEDMGPLLVPRKENALARCHLLWYKIRSVVERGWRALKVYRWGIIAAVWRKLRGRS